MQKYSLKDFFEGASIGSVNDTDSNWSKLSNKKSMKNYETPQQKLGIEDQGSPPLGHDQKLSMMDLVFQFIDNNDENTKE